MTAQELFDGYILAIMRENIDTKELFEASYLPCLNVVTAECFELNNGQRLRAGKEELTDLPIYTSMSDEILTEQAFTVACLAYGVAVMLIDVENDVNLYTVTSDKYEVMKRKFSVWKTGTTDTSYFVQDEFE